MTKFDKPGKPSHLEKWIRQRAAAHGNEGKPLLYYHPTDNVLIGREAIMAYLHLKSDATFYQYVEILGLPAIKRLDGQWLTTMSAIDQWIFIASEIDNANRGRSRATNVRLERARARIERQIQINRQAQASSAGEEPTSGDDGTRGPSGQKTPVQA